METGQLESPNFPEDYQPNKVRLMVIMMIMLLMMILLITKMTMTSMTTPTTAMITMRMRMLLLTMMIY